MSDFSGPITRLQAVNICLSSMGEPEIDTLDGAGLDAEAADNVVGETSAALQQRGWHFNREIHKISPDVNGNLIVPSNALSIDTCGASMGLDLVQRGTKLFDRVNNTYTFTAPVEVEIIALLDWDVLPAAARWAIAYTAAATFQQRILGSADVDKALSPRAKDALAVLTRDDLKSADANMLRDSWSVSRGLRRGYR